MTTVSHRQVAKTDIGQRRTENQDSYGVVRGSEVSLFIVADGMGGVNGGGTASAIAVEVAAKKCDVNSPSFSHDDLADAIKEANNSIQKYAEVGEDLDGMGTTFVALALFGENAVVANVGDSRAYLLRDEELFSLSKDHTLVQELVDSGNLDPEQAGGHPISHMLTRSLGADEEIEVDLNLLPEKPKPGDVFLLCCDGLSNHVTDAEIEQILTYFPYDQAADNLVELANERGGSDNITVQLIQIVEDGAGDEIEGGYEFITSSTQEFCDAAGNIILKEEPAPEPEPEVKKEESVIVGGTSAVDSVMFSNQPSEEDILEHQRKVEEQSQLGSFVAKEQEDNKSDSAEKEVSNEDKHPDEDTIGDVLVPIEFEDEEVEEQVLVPTPKKIKQMRTMKRSFVVVVCLGLLCVVALILSIGGESEEQVAQNSEQQEEGEKEELEVIRDVLEEAKEYKEAEAAREAMEAQQFREVKIEQPKYETPDLPTPHKFATVEDLKLNADREKTSAEVTYDWLAEAANKQQVIDQVLEESEEVESVKEDSVFVAEPIDEAIVSEEAEAIDFEPVKFNSLSALIPKLRLSDEGVWKAETCDQKETVKHYISIYNTYEDLSVARSKQSPSEIISYAVAKLKNTNAAIDASEDKLKHLKAELDAWFKRKQSFDKGEKENLAKELGAIDYNVSAAQETYAKASQDYMKTLEDFRRNPRKAGVHDKISITSNARSTARDNLLESIRSSIENGFAKMKIAIAGEAYQLEELNTSRLDQLVALPILYGELLTPPALSVNDPRLIKREKTQLLDQQYRLQMLISDEEEKAFRHQILGRLHGIN